MEYHRNSMYAKLAKLYIILGMESEGVRASKMPDFKRLTINQTVELCRKHNVIPMVAASIFGLAEDINREIKAGRPLTTFDPGLVTRGIFEVELPEVDAAGVILPITKTDEGMYYFGEFVSAMNSVRQHYDYVCLSYNAFRLAYEHQIMQSHHLFEAEDGRPRQYRHLGPLFADDEDVLGHVQIMLRIIGTIVEQSRDIDAYVDYYSAPVIDYHYEVVGRKMLDLGITSSSDLTEVLRGERKDPDSGEKLLYELCPRLRQRRFHHIEQHLRESGVAEHIVEEFHLGTYLAEACH